MFLTCRYAGDKVPESLLEGYRLPQLVAGWDDGLLRFLACRISGAVLQLA